MLKASHIEGGESSHLTCRALPSKKSKKTEATNIDVMLPRVKLKLTKNEVDALLRDTQNAFAVALKTSESEVVRVGKALIEIAKTHRPSIQQAGQDSLKAFQALLDQCKPVLNKLGENIEACFIDTGTVVEAFVDDTAKNAGALAKVTAKNLRRWLSLGILLNRPYSG